MSDLTADVLELIKRERKAQDNKWGEQWHDERWLAILMEEVGEAAKAVVEEDDRNRQFALRKELVQVAAVAAAWWECIMRRHE